MESAESEDGELRIGIQKAADFTWKQRLDFDACVSCGRCEEVCPTYLSNKEYFTPRQFLTRLKKTVTDLDARNGTGHAEEIPDLVGGAFDEEFIWHCRTCTACMEVCPAMIEHVDTLLDIRRNEVLHPGPHARRGGPRAEGSWRAEGNPFGVPVGPRRLDREHQPQGGRARARSATSSTGSAAAPPSTRRSRRSRRTCARCSTAAASSSASSATTRSAAATRRGCIGHEMLFQEIAKEQVEIEAAQVQGAAHLVPALLQRPDQRVPAVRRRLQRRPPQRVPARDAVARANLAPRYGREAQVRLPRPVLPRAATRRSTIRPAR